MAYLLEKFHFYDKEKTFKEHRDAGLINPDSICFIKETHQIFTQGTIFGVDTDIFTRLSEMVAAHDSLIKNALGIEGTSVGNYKLDNIEDFKKFLDDYDTDDTLKSIITETKQALGRHIVEVGNILQEQIDTINLYLENVVQENLGDLVNLAREVDSLKIKIGYLEESYQNLSQLLDSEVDNLSATINGVKTRVLGVETTVTNIVNSKGAPNGIATLDGTGKVPTSQLPSYVDDVLEFPSLSSFPSTGEDGKIYIAKDTDLTYRWSGTQYTEISKSIALGLTSSTAFPGDKGAQAVADIKTQEHRISNITGQDGHEYEPTTASTYIKSATSMSHADEILDRTLASNVSHRKAVTGLQNEYTPHSDISQISDATSLHDADRKLAEWIQSLPAKPDVSILAYTYKTGTSTSDLINWADKNLRPNTILLIKLVSGNGGDITYVDSIQNAPYGPIVLTGPLWEIGTGRVKAKQLGISGSGVEEQFYKIDESMIPPHADDRWYGIEWGGTDWRDAKMIGHPTLIRNKPIQNKIRGCVYNTLDKRVVYWLDPNNWNYIDGVGVVTVVTEGVMWSVPDHEGGYSVNQPLITTDKSSNILPLIDKRFEVINTPSTNPANKGKIVTISEKSIWDETGSRPLRRHELVDIDTYNPLPEDTYELRQISRLDGTDGEVMIYIPEFYILGGYDTSTNKQSVKISEYKIDGNWVHQPACFVGAYMDTTLKTVPRNHGYISRLEQDAAVSICNSEEFCRGGDGSTVYDADPVASTLGKPKTSMSLNQYRVYCEKSNKKPLTHNIYKNILWLCVIDVEYFGSSLEKKLCCSFPLNAEKWNTINRKNPLVKNGITNSIGNGTGNKYFSIQTEDNVSVSARVPRWRGFEGFSCHIWTLLDNINFYSAYSMADLSLEASSIVKYVSKYDDGSSRETILAASGTNVQNTDDVVLISKQLMALNPNADIIASSIQNAGSYNLIKVEYKLNNTLKYIVVGGGSVASSWNPFYFLFSKTEDSTSSVIGGRSYCLA